jgi:hypothetical protein
VIWHVLRHHRLNTTDFAQRTFTVSPFGSLVDEESGLRTQHAPIIGRRQNARAVILWDGLVVQALQADREVSVAVDSLTGSSNP